MKYLLPMSGAVTTRVCTVRVTARRRGDAMAGKIVEGPPVLVEEMTTEQGREMLERLAQERFQRSWDDFYEAYCRGEFVGTDLARDAEELAFLYRFAG